MITVTVQDSADRDALLLALAILSLDRPGWHDYLAGIAEQVGADRPGSGREAFEKFRRLNADRWAAAPPRPLL